jgi:hypothetical protein
MHPLDPIARVCHEVNRAYCAALGDNSQPTWGDAPEWQRESARMGVDLHLMGDFGPESSHAAWMKLKLDDGWRYGPVKDVTKLEHPCLVPFDQLPREQQAKDYIFRAIVHALKGTLLQPKVTGYRQLSPAEVALMNEGKALAEQCGAYVEKLRGHAAAADQRFVHQRPTPGEQPPLDQRWVSLGATDLQRGFMELIRGIAQPTTF